MGVYINMEMPHSCMDCIMSNLECDWCILSKSKIPKESRFENRMRQCPLVPVPPHGRLIDADALINDHPRTWTTYDLQRIANAPTIIPADPAEEPKEE